MEGGGEVETDRGQRLRMGKPAKAGRKGVGWGEDSKERKNPLGRSVGKHGPVCGNYSATPCTSVPFFCASSVPMGTCLAHLLQVPGHWGWRGPHRDKWH